MFNVINKYMVVLLIVPILSKIYVDDVVNESQSYQSLTTVQSPSNIDENLTGYIRQGDRVYIGKVACTIGYIDRENHHAYLAGHCVQKEGEKAYNESWEEIGEVIKDNLLDHNKKYWTESGDTAVIQIDNKWSVENTFSGDEIVDQKDVHRWQKVCSYGATTREVYCGRIKKSEEGFFMFNLKGHPQGGDSGGPIWSPDRGLVGVLSGVENGVHTASMIDI